MVLKTVEIAACVVRDAEGFLLMAERTARQVSPFFWELPGGKIERGETAEQAARRELAEETGLQAVALRPMTRYAYDFPTKRVLLNIFDATAWRGRPSGREGQRLAWVDPAAPAVAPILPSVARVLSALALPPAVEIVDLSSSALTRTQAALADGAKLLQLRGDRLAPDQKVALARRIGAMARAHGAKVLLAGTALEAGRAGLDGVHSDTAALASMRRRPPLPLWSVEANEARDWSRAAVLGADFALTNPGAQACPPELALPVYAIGAAGRATRAAL